jgi:hypothetical protein
VRSSSLGGKTKVLRTHCQGGARGSVSISGHRERCDEDEHGDKRRLVDLPGPVTIINTGSPAPRINGFGQRIASQE